MKEKLSTEWMFAEASCIRRRASASAIMPESSGYDGNYHANYKTHVLRLHLDQHKKKTTTAIVFQGGVQVPGFWNTFAVLRKLCSLPHFFCYHLS